MNKLLVVSIILLAWFPSTANADPKQYLAMISAEIGMATAGNPQVTPSPAPAPTPPPTPSPADVCSNCRGKGTVGDGVVKVTCPSCGGTGRVKPAAIETPSEASTSGVARGPFRRFGRRLGVCLGGNCN